MATDELGVSYCNVSHLKWLGHKTSKSLTHLPVATWKLWELWEGCHKVRYGFLQSPLLSLLSRRHKLCKCRMRKLPQSGHGHGYISVLLVQVGGRRSIRLTTRSARRKILALISPHHITSHPPTQKGPRFGAPEISTTCCGPGPQKKVNILRLIKVRQAAFPAFPAFHAGGLQNCWNI